MFPHKITRVFRKYRTCSMLFIRQIARVDLYRKCFQILGVTLDADLSEVRQAYLQLVKKVHPDSGLPEASAERFQEVDEAFKLLQEKFAKERHNIEYDEQEQVPDICHTAPQHRQYLNNEGFGLGNPFERQKQYAQVRAMRAQEHVFEHRLRGAQISDKEGLLVQDADGFEERPKASYEQIADELIQKAITRGEFNNLRGAGKPLPDSSFENPFVDFTTQKLNKILMDNGFAPQWISMQRDIKEDTANLKDNLAEERVRNGEKLLPDEWRRAMQKRYAENMQNINKKIDHFNIIVPIIERQLFRLNLDKLLTEVLNDEKLTEKLKETRKQLIEEPQEEKLNWLTLIRSLFPV